MLSFVVEKKNKKKPKHMNKNEQKTQIAVLTDLVSHPVKKGIPIPVYIYWELVGTSTSMCFVYIYSRSLSRSSILG